MELNVVVFIYCLLVSIFWVVCVVLCLFVTVVFFFKQKTAYGMGISDCSSDVCSSDLSRGCYRLLPQSGMSPNILYRYRCGSRSWRVSSFIRFRRPIGYKERQSSDH